MGQPIAYRPTTVAAINTTDFKRAIAWYEEMLGFELDYAVEEVGWAEMRTNVPGFTIGVNRIEPGSGDVAGGNSTTLTFSVEDIDAARGYLEGKGVRFDGPTREIPGMVRLCDFFDPDGNRYMLAGPPSQR